MHINTGNRLEKEEPDKKPKLFNEDVSTRHDSVKVVQINEEVSTRHDSSIKEGCSNPHRHTI